MGNIFYASYHGRPLMDVSSQRLAVAKLENPPPRQGTQRDLLKKKRRGKKDPEHQIMIG